MLTIAAEQVGMIKGDDCVLFVIFEKAQKYQCQIFPRRKRNVSARILSWKVKISLQEAPERKTRNESTRDTVHET